MTEANWLRHGVRIGIVEFRRTVRGMRRHTGRLAMLVFGVGFWSLMIAGMGVLFAGTLRSLDTLRLPASVRGGVALFWAFGAFIAGQRTLSQNSHIESEAGMLTTVSPRSVATGLAVAELLRAASYLLIPVLAATAAVVYVFGTPLVVVTLPLAATLFVLTALVVGSAFGYAGALVVARSRFVARYKTLIGGALALVFFGGYAAFVFLPTGDRLGPALFAWLPVGWYVDLALVASPVAVSVGRIGGVLVVTVALLALGGRTLERLTAALWFTDPVEPARGGREDAGTDTETAGTPLAAALGPVAMGRTRTPTRHVARKALVRTWRNPSRLTILLTPVVIVGVSLFNAVQAGFGPLVAPVAVVLVVPWLAGATFGLNPLGDEGAVLPATLTTGLSGRAFVRGLALPGLVVGLPTTVALTLLAGWWSPYSILDIAGLVALGCVLVVAAVCVAPAVGTRIPRFSTFTVRGSREVVPPSLTAGVVYTVLLGVPGAFGAFALLAPSAFQTLLSGLFGVVIPALLRWFADLGLSVAAAPAPWFVGLGNLVENAATVRIRWVGYGLSLCVLLVGGVAAYRAAARRFDNYEIA